MAKDPSFDIVSEVDMQVIDDCVNVATKEIDNRFDFKGQNIKIELNKGEKTITIIAPADFVLNQVKDILFQKFIKRGLNQKCLKEKKKEKAAGDAVREIDEIVHGIDKDLAKQIVKDIKDMKLKVQASIQDEQIRVSGAKKDDLQAVISMIKEKDYPIPLQFTNYR
ncbi:YajQ family cyclic di-GMP-binding protein [Brachyspira alvinipulli]|uniref:YajQ family cyclic di-GMP-binding protein n=1 Tax=Brachyspira alvinipulli TaxID=84379 RepID=UPI003007A8A3